MQATERASLPAQLNLKFRMRERLLTFFDVLHLLPNYHAGSELMSAFCGDRDVPYV